MQSPLRARVAQRMAESAFAPFAGTRPTPGTMDALARAVRERLARLRCPVRVSVSLRPDGIVDVLPADAADCPAWDAWLDDDRER